MSPEMNSWATAEAVRRRPLGGRVVALVDGVDDGRIAHLAQAASVECIARPQGAALNDLLVRLARPTTAPPRADTVAAPEPPTTFHDIVGRSKQMLRIFSLIEKVASGDANVCIYGESGTGKELIARAVHASSSRAGRPMVTLDCTAIPEGLMESQLFGHVKGAFTGAVEHREGVFSLANTGTLFMDELCELGLPLQAKLLRVIQAREFSKVGSSKALTTNVRLIAATNKDLKQAVDRGAFREDLYYRVAVIMLKIPALRERREDIALLVGHFLQKFSTMYSKQIRGIEPIAMERLISSPWPGNVRQLQNFLEQAVVLADGDMLRERDLFVSDQPSSRGLAARTLEIEPDLPLREVERRYILRTLSRTQGRRTQAAKALGISLRALQYKLKAYMLEEEDRSSDSKPRTVSSGASMAWVDRS